MTKDALIPLRVVEHTSDCVVHNAPAYEPGECDCGAAKANKKSHQVESDEDLLTVLREVYPYLRSIKARKVELMMAWLESRIPKRNKGSNLSRAYTDDENDLARRIRVIK